jgi:hypothetical protein
MFGSSDKMKGRKSFHLRPDQIKQVAVGYGGCFASDQITVDGLKVGYMYREEPIGDEDSGWRFLSGKESQGYLDDPTHTEIYEVNTIANYDPEIIPFLGEPVGAAFARDIGGKLVRADHNAPE